PCHGSIDEAMIEVGIVSHQDGALALVGLDGLANDSEHLIEYFLLRARDAQRMPGIDACELESGLFDVGALEGNDAVEEGLLHAQHALAVEAQDDGGNLQNGVGLAVETTALDVHHYRKVAAETVGHGAVRRVL